MALPSDPMLARIERLEAIVALLCEEAAAGKGSMGKPFWQFVDDWRREHSGQLEVRR